MDMWGKENKERKKPPDEVQNSNLTNPILKYI
jgi:hypothetical protein